MQNKNSNKNKTNNRPAINVGISIGDMNGIGPEIIIKALSTTAILEDCAPIIYGSTKVLSFYNKTINEEGFQYQGIKNASDKHPKKINVVNCWNEVIDIHPGKTNHDGGKYAYLALQKATEDLTTGKIDVLVTAPISKEAMHLADFKFPGHTEYLASLSGQNKALMMMVSDNLRVALVTSHLALKKAIESITVEKIYDKIIQLHKSLKNDFGIIKPKIAVLGLNPHAGEKGAMGDEEANIITPAITKANNENLLVYGPYPADGFFGSRQFNQFDAVLSMYHDQGLTGFKSIAFNTGVNYTAGLPIVRTSPDHGTAFDIAGKGQADAQSFRSAIYLACDIFRKRQFIKEISANPLEKQKM